MVDERRGLPSASSFDRLAVCPGSFIAEKNLPDESNEMSEAGDLGHACLAGEIHIDELDDDTAKTVIIAKSIEERRIESYGFKNAVQIREKRLWFEIDGVKQFSGKPDLILLDGKNAMIIDYKTGPLQVEHAGKNMQLRALMFLVDKEYGPLEAIYVCILQPRAKLQWTSCMYLKNDIELSYLKGKQNILQILENVKDPNAPRNATEEGCRYCKAKPTCPEANQTIMDIQKTENNLPAIPTPDLLEKCAIAKKLIAKLEENARNALLADPCAIPGYMLKPGSTRKVINNPEGVFYQAAILGIDGSEFASICDVNKTKLKALIKEKTGRKGAQLDEAVAEILEGNTTEKQNKPSLAKDKSYEKI
jgi:hypothetical protein